MFFKLDQRSRTSSLYNWFIYNLHKSQTNSGPDHNGPEYNVYKPFLLLESRHTTNLTTRYMAKMTR